jgi:hypothetical protein
LVASGDEWDKVAQAKVSGRRRAMATADMPTPVRDGWTMAIDRVVETDLFDGAEPDDAAKRVAQATVEEARGVLDGDEPPRYVDLFIELVAVGALARVRYGEEPLRVGEIKALHDLLRRLLNSWGHRLEPA